MTRAALLLVALTGCARLLGLDDTRFEPDDGGVDAPGVCDGAPRCTSTTGRSICGQLRDTGMRGGSLLRAATPTGEVCASNNLEGPCAFVVTALAMSTYFAGGTAGSVAGTVDDCGRFVVADVELAIADVAVVFTPSPGELKQAATIVAQRPAAPGADRDLEAYVVSEVTAFMWGSQLSPATPPDTSTGFLVGFREPAGTPITGAQIATDDGAPLANPPGTTPWAAYFAGPRAFGSLDTGVTATASSGTAIAVVDGGPLSIDGVRPGKRCKVAGLVPVPNVWIYIAPPSC